MAYIQTYSCWGECGVRLEYGAIAPLPSDLSNETSANLEDLASGIRSIGMANGNDERCDILGLLKSTTLRGQICKEKNYIR